MSNYGFNWAATFPPRMRSLLRRGERPLRRFNWAATFPPRMLKAWEDAREEYWLQLGRDVSAADAMRADLFANDDWRFNWAATFPPRMLR